MSLAHPWNTKKCCSFNLQTEGFLTEVLICLPVHVVYWIAPVIFIVPAKTTETHANINPRNLCIVKRWSSYNNNHYWNTKIMITIITPQFYQECKLWQLTNLHSWNISTDVWQNRSFQVCKVIEIPAWFGIKLRIKWEWSLATGFLGYSFFTTSGTCVLSWYWHCWNNKWINK